MSTSPPVGVPAALYAGMDQQHQQGTAVVPATHATTPAEAATQTAYGIAPIPYPATDTATAVVAAASPTSPAGSSPDASRPSPHSLEDEVAGWERGKLYGSYRHAFIQETVRKVQQGEDVSREARELAVKGLDPGRGLLMYQEELGRGGFGTVTKARSALSGKAYAVKKAHEGSILSCQISEMAVYNRMGTHKNIVECCAVDDRFQGAPILYEFCDGGEMWTVATGKHPMDNICKLELVLDVASGLQHAHTHHVIHQDIKLENVLLQRKHADDLGGGRCPFVAKIADFGLACYIDDARKCQGTLGYISPEAIFDYVPSMPSQDTYALGHMMMVLLAKDDRKTTNMFTMPALVTKFDHEAYAKLPTDEDRASFESLLVRRNMTDPASLDYLLSDEVFPETLTRIPLLLLGMRRLLSPHPRLRPEMPWIIRWVNTILRSLLTAEAADIPLEVASTAATGATTRTAATGVMAAMTPSVPTVATVPTAPTAPTVPAADIAATAAAAAAAAPAPAPPARQESVGSSVRMNAVAAASGGRERSLPPSAPASPGRPPLLTSTDRDIGNGGDSGGSVGRGPSAARLVEIAVGEVAQHNVSTGTAPGAPGAYSYARVFRHAADHVRQDRNSGEMRDIAGGGGGNENRVKESPIALRIRDCGERRMAARKATPREALADTPSHDFINVNRNTAVAAATVSPPICKMPSYPPPEATEIVQARSARPRGVGQQETVRRCHGTSVYQPSAAEYPQAEARGARVEAYQPTAANRKPQQYKQSGGSAAVKVPAQGGVAGGRVGPVALIRPPPGFPMRLPTPNYGGPRQNQRSSNLAPIIPPQGRQTEAPLRPPPGFSARPIIPTTREREVCQGSGVLVPVTRPLQGDIAGNRMGVGAATQIRPPPGFAPLHSTPTDGEPQDLQWRDEPVPVMPPPPGGIHGGRTGQGAATPLRPPPGFAPLEHTTVNRTSWEQNSGSNSPPGSDNTLPPHSGQGNKKNRKRKARRHKRQRGSANSRQGTGGASSAQLSSSPSPPPPANKRRGRRRSGRGKRADAAAPPCPIANHVVNESHNLYGVDGVDGVYRHVLPSDLVPRAMHAGGSTVVHHRVDPSYYAGQWYGTGYGTGVPVRAC